MPETRKLAAILAADPGKSERRRARPVNLIVKARGPSGPAKIRSDDPKHALSLVQYLRTIGYKAWIEDTDGKEIEETVLMKAIR
jgi:hypothetical protein